MRANIINIFLAVRLVQNPVKVKLLGADAQAQLVRLHATLTILPLFFRIERAHPYHHLHGATFVLRNKMEEKFQKRSQSVMDRPVASVLNKNDRRSTGYT